MNTLLERDQTYIWHPFTQHKNQTRLIEVDRAEGSWIWDKSGKKYFDAISSWWVNIHGHAHPILKKALQEQFSILDHVLFAGCTHEPAVGLAERLAPTLPGKLTRFFYSDNGSTAVEAAIKMAYQYAVLKGQSQRKKFVVFSQGYHGDTLGAVSLGQHSRYHQMFADLCFDVYVLPFPDLHQCTQEELTETVVKAQILAQEVGEQVAALVYEPMVQGAGGMRIASSDHLDLILKTFRDKGALLVADEVMTGFYRTGTLWASNQHKQNPDLFCISKGITGGTLPLALTIATEEIYEAFLSDNPLDAFLHGHSYTANPLACAVACASFDLLMLPATLIAIKDIEKAHQEGLNTLKDIKNVSGVRTIGTIAAFEYPYSPSLKQAYYDHGLLIRPLLNTTYLLPPYCASQELIRTTYQSIEKILKEDSQRYHCSPCQRQIAEPC